MKQCLIMARLQILGALMLFLVVLVGGHTWIRLTWVSCLDRFQPIWNAGVIDTDALASFREGMLVHDPTDIPAYLIQGPLLNLSRLVNVTSAVALIWLALSLVLYWRVREFNAEPPSVPSPTPDMAANG